MKSNPNPITLLASRANRVLHSLVRRRRTPLPPMKPTLLLLLFGTLLESSAFATTIYSWVDQNGRTQMSDVVPEKYKKTATRIESARYELSDAQRAESDARVNVDKSRAADTAARQEKARSEAASAASAPPSTVVRQSPRAANNEASDCATLHRLYRESDACFAPYKTTNGATKAEGYARCTERLDPTFKCGPYKGP